MCYHHTIIFYYLCKFIIRFPNMSKNFNAYPRIERLLKRTVYVIMDPIHVTLNGHY